MTMITDTEANAIRKAAAAALSRSTLVALERSREALIDLNACDLPLGQCDVPQCNHALAYVRSALATYEALLVE